MYRNVSALSDAQLPALSYGIVGFLVSQNWISIPSATVHHGSSPPVPHPETGSSLSNTNEGIQSTPTPQLASAIPLQGSSGWASGQVSSGHRKHAYINWTTRESDEVKKSENNDR